MQKTNNHHEKIPDFTLIFDVKERIDTIVAFAKVNRNIMPSECLKLGEHARLLAFQIEYKEGLIAALIIKAYQHWHLSQLDLSTQELDQSESLQHELKYYNELGEFAMVRAMIYWGKGNYERAMAVLFDTLRTLEKHEIEKGKGWVYWVLGVFNYDLKDYDKSLLFYERALDSFNNFETRDPGELSYCLIGLGCCFMRKGDSQIAEKYFNEALEISIRNNLWMQEARTLYEIGMMLFGENKYQEAEMNLQKSYEMRKANGTKPGMVSSLLALSDVKIACNHISQAMNILEEALNISTEINAKTKTYQCHEKLASLYKQTENFKEAIRHIELFYQIRSEVVGEEASNQLKNLETNYAKEKAEQEADIQRLRNVELKKAHDIIAEKNKEIIDSIEYAKRIQQAKLPNKELIYAQLPHCFILFKPKDIVSGDFYYFHKNEQHVFIAAADCTGHGVPGALMSMLSSEKLDDALRNTSNVSEILSSLNSGIKSSLKQTESFDSTRDGLDIALCAINLEKGLIMYAGANRPLWLIRNGSDLVEEIKATKKAIGGLTDDCQQFDTHEIKFEKGDTFYISTDGFADTFGGVAKKKLTTKRFKEILISIKDKSLIEQGKFLDSFIDNWKLGLEQIDDILVIGVRL
jgi:serine phosphatase RsbU (regulator of sigma subunit)/Tfp pilus assembly protein PilF